MLYSMPDCLAFTFCNSILENSSEVFEKIIDNYKTYTNYISIFKENVFILFKDESVCLILDANVFCFKSCETFISNQKYLKKMHPKSFKDLFNKIKEELNGN